MDFVKAVILALGAWWAFCSSAVAQIVVMQEAEDCLVRKAHPDKKPMVTDWASGTKFIGEWGLKVNDAVTWDFVLASPVSDGRLAIRYAADVKWLTEKRGPQDERRLLTVGLDGVSTTSVALPDTGGWHDFETVYVQLPPVPAGRHVFRFIATGDKMAANLDCFTIVSGDPAGHLTRQFRSTIVASQASPCLRLKVTPHARINWQPEAVLADFTKIYHFLADQTGRVPHVPCINIHVYEDKLMRRKAFNAFQDGAGIHFQASNSNWDKGNWVHEMLHMFHDGSFPGWFDHPLIRANETFNAYAGIFPVIYEPVKTRHERGIRERSEAGRRLLLDPKATTDDPHHVVFALRVKYGPQFLRKFYYTIRDAGRRGEIKFGPGIFVPKEIIAKYLSIAAGEDVTPVLKQWTGWETAHN